MSGPPAESRFIHETGVASGIAELAEPVLESLGYRLVLVRILQGQGTTVEIMAERPDGSMTIEDCRAVSLGLSPVLDVHDPIAASYRLQISSPGIDRPLVRPADFERWAGFEAKIELKAMIDGRKRFRGLLDGFEDGEVRIEIDLGKELGRAVIGLPIDMVGQAHLVLTDDLVRESLRRTKRQIAEAGGQDDGALVNGALGDGMMADAPTDLLEAPTGMKLPARRHKQAKRKASEKTTGVEDVNPGVDEDVKDSGPRKFRKPDRRRQRSDLA